MTISTVNNYGSFIEKWFLKKIMKRYFLLLALFVLTRGFISSADLVVL